MTFKFTYQKEGDYPCCVFYNIPNLIKGMVVANSYDDLVYQMQDYIMILNKDWKEQDKTKS